MNRGKAMRKAANVLRSACVLPLAVLAGGCLTASVGSQRLARYRPNVKPYRPPVAKVATPAPVPRLKAPPVSVVPSARRPKAKPTPAPAPATAPKPRPPAAQLGTANDVADLLRVGDEITIIILGVENIQVEDVIDHEGNVNLKYIGQMKIAGKTSTEAEKTIETAYIDGGYFTRVTVTVFAKKENFFVHGEVTKAGGFPWKREMTLMKAIGAAGGFTPFAKESKIELHSGNIHTVHDAERILGGEDQDPPIKPGDVVVVKRRWGFK